MRTALLTAFRHDWSSALLIASDLEVVALPGESNPFGLPEGDADVVVVERSWFDRAGIEGMDRLSGVLVGLDGGDDFALGFPPEAIDRMALLIKPQGLYRDRDRYNDSDSWERGWRYSDAQLDKLRLSVPCLLTKAPELRRAVREREAGEENTIGRRMGMPERLARNAADGMLSALIAHAPLRGRRKDVHCVVGPTNPQRLEGLERLHGLSGNRGIVGQDREPTSRTRYLLDLCRHRIGFAPAGYGEWTWRHGEVWQCGAALVCQDLSHVETMYPLGENVVYCRPDLSDLREVVDALLADEERRLRVARQGRQEWQEWTARWRDHLYAGMEAHVREALQYPEQPSEGSQFDCPRPPSQRAAAIRW